MSSEIDDEFERQRHCTAIANLMLAARDFNALGCAAGLVSISQMLAGDDLRSRAILARLMVDVAKELDSDVLNAPLRWQ